VKGLIEPPAGRLLSSNLPFTAFLNGEEVLIGDAVIGLMVSNFPTDLVLYYFV